MSLNFAPIDGDISGGIGSCPYDYAELVEDLETDISSFPLLTIILNKLRERYFFKRERIHEIISADFLDFEKYRDEIGDYFHNNRLEVDTVSQIDKLYEEKSILTPDYINMTKNTDSIVHDVVKNVEADIGINFDDTLIAVNKLRDYQRDLAFKYLEIRKILRERLGDINKQVKIFETLKDTFDFEKDDKLLISDIIDKYIDREDFAALIKEYIPIKMKLYTMLAINRFSGLRNIGQGECRICFTPTSKLYAVIGCGHTFCKTCIDSIHRCALCRIPIKNKMRIYL